MTQCFKSKADRHCDEEAGTVIAAFINTILSNPLSLNFNFDIHCDLHKPHKKSSTDEGKLSTQPKPTVPTKPDLREYPKKHKTTYAPASADISRNSQAVLSTGWSLKPAVLLTLGVMGAFFSAW